MRYLIFILYIFAIGCKNQGASHNDTNTQKKEIQYHLIDSFGSVSRDTSEFYKLNCGLFRNMAGVIGYQAVDKSREEPRIVYLVSIYYADMKDTLNGGLMEMNKVIDTATFKMAGDYYFEDKNHIYNFHPMMDGGTISVSLDADIKSFKILGNGIYAKDKRHCYCRGHLIEGADNRSFNIFRGKVYNFAYDKKHFYSGDWIMSKEDVKDMGLDTLRLKTR